MFDPGDKDPFVLLDEWLLEAAQSEINDANAVALATVGGDGFPSVRMVLLKGRDSEALHFYTNLTSRKASELDGAGTGAMCFHWKSLRRQVRLVGRIERLDDVTADRYFEERPYGSRIGAWASDQSKPLESRAVLESAVKRFAEQYPEDPPRPPHWGGYRLIPHEIEFWVDGEARLHDRFLFTKEKGQGQKGQWSSQRLYP